jgi:Lrp/AsnC family transcriptional regulator, leucine-responsive regulatory protein
VLVDDLDRTIVNELQRDGRQTNAHLAAKVNLSPSATLERVRRLETEGIIAGYRAKLDPRALGLQVQAYIGVRLRLHNRTPILEFEREICRVESVISCTHVTGQFDYVLHVAVPDLDHLHSLIRDDLSGIPGVANMQTMLWLSEIKSDGGWPVERTGFAGQRQRGAY